MLSQEVPKKTVRIDFNKLFVNVQDNPLAIVSIPLIGLSIILGTLWLLDSRMNGGVFSPKGSLALTSTTSETEVEYRMSRARDSKRVSDIDQIRAALKAYRLDNNSYPKTLGGLVPGYIKSVPKDPISNSHYQFTHAGSSYLVTYSLEVGIEWKNTMIPAGTQVASPEAIARVAPELPEGYENSCQ